MSDDQKKQRQIKKIPMSYNTYKTLKQMLESVAYVTLKPIHVTQFDDGTMTLILYGKIKIELSHRVDGDEVSLVYKVVVSDFEFLFSSIRDTVVACRLAITFDRENDSGIEKSEM